MIPTHQRPGLLRRLLESLASCRKPEGFLGVTVVENGERQGVEAIVAQAPRELRVCYLHLAQANKSAALNLSLEHADDELLLFLDDDVRVEPDILCAYVRTASRITGPAYFGGPLQADLEVLPQPWLRLPGSVRGWSLPAGSLTVDSPRFLGANWAAYADQLRAAGGFNPEVGPGGTTGAGGQEREMQHRLHARGVAAIYVEQALVWHWVPASRCSVEWSIRRAWERGVAYGLRIREKGLISWTAQSVRIRLREYREARTETFLALGYSMKLEFAWWRGYVTGCLQRFITTTNSPGTGRLQFREQRSATDAAIYDYSNRHRDTWAAGPLPPNSRFAGSVPTASRISGHAGR
ncbi:MAG: glycosyltransferase [Planctomycetaceae bacterium]|nr:glycosyltransferase [Planctomycetaceae bacterium]